MHPNSLQEAVSDRERAITERSVRSGIGRAYTTGHTKIEDVAARMAELEAVT